MRVSAWFRPGVKGRCRLSGGIFLFGAGFKNVRVVNRCPVGVESARAPTITRKM